LKKKYETKILLIAGGGGGMIEVHRAVFATENIM